MNRKLAILTAGMLGCLMTLQSCNSDSDNNSLDNVNISTGDAYSSTAINSFNIKANSKVLAHLDSVFFTIDLAEARIFNADSLPYGTDVSKLVLNLGSETISKITISFTDPETNEAKQVEYGSSTNDSINFNAPVAISVLSANELYERTYDVKVNVHKVKTDSLCWGSMAYATLPVSAVPVAQKTVKKDAVVYCLIQTADGYTMSTTSTPADNGSWTESRISGVSPDVKTLAATSDALYVLDDAGNLYRSSDGIDWMSTGSTGWYSVIGGYGDTLLGVRKSGADYTSATYPAVVAAESAPLPQGFPVDGQSATVTFTTQWSDNPQAIFVGGRCADGTLSSSTWGFDGTEWVRFSNLPKNIGLQGVSLVPYSMFDVNTVNWTVKEFDTLLAFGGREADGSQSRKVYISRDWGMNWHLADELMQLPADMPAVAFAQAVVVESTMGDGADAVSGWYPIETLSPNRLWWDIADMPALSRASRPITTWQCPYLYLFGGVAENDVLYNTVWRGVINRMIFKPLQ